MVKALFDTNILIDYLNGVEAARAELALHDQRAICVITWMEVLVGATPANERRTRAFLAGFTVIAIDATVAELAVQLRRAHRIRLPDAIIWATAKVQARLLVTRNTRDFPIADPGVREPYRL